MLSEHATSAKLEVLYRRNLFALAISLARSHGIGDAGVADIHRRYGDYLYSKGDFEGAMGQFVKTLGYLQPSYVIRNVCGLLLPLNCITDPVSAFSSLTRNGYIT